MTSTALRDAVRRRYAQIARTRSVETSIAPSHALEPEREDVCSPQGCGNPVALAALSPGAIVLDLGSGTGFDVVRAARQVGPTGFVYGLDMTDEMLVVAAENARDLGVANVAFLKGTIEDVPLPDSSVDVVISNCVINLSTDKRRALGEARRVLRPGGRLALADIVMDGPFAGWLLTEARVRRLLQFTWSRCVAGALTVDEYRCGLVEAGFEDIVVEIRHRYSPADLLQSGKGLAQALTPSPITRVVSRFTRSVITARRPGRPALSREPAR